MTKVGLSGRHFVINPGEVLPLSDKPDLGFLNMTTPDDVLLSETKGWNTDKINQAVRSGDQVNVSLTKAVPLHWVYVTAWSASK